MTFTRLVAIALTAGVLTTGAAEAQIKRTQPAEFPPASYTGKQYVDSKGCVFIRAGIDGTVSWVPRVTRARKIICGFTPSLGAQTAAAAPAPAAPSTQVEQITIEPAAAPAPAVEATVASAPVPAAPAPQVVRQTAPKPALRKPAAKPLVITNPIVEAEVQPAPAPAPTRKVIRRKAQAQQVATACPNASPLSQEYLRGTERSPVRCGPQAAPIVGGSYRTAAVPQTRRVLRRQQAAQVTSSVTDTTRIVPKHVAINRINTTNVKVPHGYRSVWTDGRLNPKRAEQNLRGRGQMLLVWTNTVPRRLIDRRSGRDVTATVPLVYPYLDVATQSKSLGEVSIVRKDGQVVKRVVRNSAKPRTTYSTRSAPKVTAKVPARAKPAAGGKRFVQIGLFSTKAKAQRATQTLAGLGMRAQIAKVRYKGKTYLSVKAGPFANGGATQKAVNRLQGAGYTGARARD